MSDMTPKQRVWFGMLLFFVIVFVHGCSRFVRYVNDQADHDTYIQHENNE